MAGDFNCIDSAQVNMGGRLFVGSIEAREFREFMRMNGLVDLGFSGSRFI